jgi:hypothetical protein
VRRGTALRGGIVFSFMVGTVALCGFGTSSAALAGTVEFHAPRIPAPNPTTPTVTPTYGYDRGHVNLGWSSRNWSGYAVTDTGITSVVGHWTVPTVHTPAKKAQQRKNAYSSSWVGIDGFNNSHLIQAGTEQDWQRSIRKHPGSGFYQAWWEILPAAETPITSITVHPGDAMTVSITEGAANRWTIEVADTTTGQTFSIVETYTGPKDSAEWIQEAPTIGRRVAALADDSNTVFDLGRVNGATPGLTSSDGGAMFKGKAQISTPSAPNPNQDGFAVAYGSVAPVAPSS